MPLKNCCTPKNPDSNVNVTVNVDVPRIVKYACITGVLIVGIIFGNKSFHKMLEHGFFDTLSK